jgi:hypothetical protein
MRRVILATSASEDAESYGHLMISDALDRARVPFWTRATTIRNAAELSQALARGGVDLVHFTDAAASAFAPMTREYAVTASLFLDDVPLSSRARDDLDLVDLALLEEEGLVESLNCRTSVIGPCLDVDAFDPAITALPREHLASVDDESRMLLALGSDDEVEKILAELSDEVAAACNIIAMCSAEGSALLNSPPRIIALLQHAEAMILGEGSHFHPQISLHAAAAGCPTINCMTSDPRDWADEISSMHNEWRSAGGVPRFPDEEAIARVRNTNGLRAYGQALEKAWNEVISQ